MDKTSSSAPALRDRLTSLDFFRGIVALSNPLGSLPHGRRVNLVPFQIYRQGPGVRSAAVRRFSKDASLDRAVRDCARRHGMWEYSAAGNYNRRSDSHTADRDSGL